MTDISYRLTPHIAPLVPPISALPSPSPSLANATNGFHHGASLPEEEEPYTIKCICIFDDDDGNTVFCEKCETWQHIDCYYPEEIGLEVLNAADRVHNCVDCEPRQVDPKRATEQQRRARGQQGLTERKTKRPPGKSHKKKLRENPQLNGLPNHDRPDTPRDQPSAPPPPAKRTKTAHRSNHSITLNTASLPYPPLGPFDPHKRAYSLSTNARSPANSPSTSYRDSNGHRPEPFSPEFMDLYSNDPGDQILEANLHNNVNVMNALYDWTHNPSAFRAVVNGHSYDDIFRCVEIDDQPFDSFCHYRTSLVTRTDESVEFYGKHPMWRMIVLETFAPARSMVGELKGKVSLTEDYTHNLENRWHILNHPEPFVFLHPELPICIDTRREGSRLRYLRRSCRPNLAMKIWVANSNDYHYCFVARHDIPPQTELTIGWEIDEQVKRLLNRERDVKTEDNGDHTDIAFETECDWVELILSNFGGCACNLGPACTFAPVLNRQRNRALANAPNPSPNGVKPKRSRKRKQQVSPLGTGFAANSRAGSENVNREHDDENEDARSASDSLRSKPRSRDLTPATRTPTEPPAAFSGVEISDREKRKNAAVERIFEKTELDQQHQAQKKKKRNSGGSALNTPAASSNKHFGPPTPILPATPSAIYRAEYVNAGTSQTTSPIGEYRMDQSVPSLAAIPPSRKWFPPPKDSIQPASRPCYVDSSVQTEDENEAWYKPASMPPPRKPFIPLTKQLLMRCHENNARLEAENKKRKVCDADPELPPSKRAMLNMQPETQASPEAEPKQDSPSRENIVKTPDPIAESSITDPKISPVAISKSPCLAPRPPSPKLVNMMDPIFPPTVLAAPAAPANAQVGRRISNGYRNSDLRVQLPPTPLFSSQSSSAPIVQSITTPLSATSSVAQSPFGNPTLSSLNALPQPSPVKKTISFSDWSKRKQRTGTPTKEKTAPSFSPTTSSLPPKPPTSNFSSKPPTPVYSPTTAQMQPQSPNLPLKPPQAPLFTPTTPASLQRPSSSHGETIHPLPSRPSDSNTPTTSSFLNGTAKDEIRL
ncbi:MAG: hypothetical protein M1829_002516 [Trizodia sp. TS-e1964]|nr:MAG: hypothetical protein M1829_002516 [Trizodia sp. TS-e1964]